MKKNCMRIWFAVKMLAALVVVIAMLAGCRSDAPEIVGAYVDDDEYNTQAEPGYGERQTEDHEEYYGPDPEEYDVIPNINNAAGLYDDSPVVATARGIDITANDVLREFGWAQNVLMHEYISMFPEDMAFDYSRIFGEDMTFGEVVREEAARLALIIKLFEEYANQHGLAFDNNDQFLHVINVVLHAAIDDPILFEEFAPYMPEDGPCESELKATEILARAQAGEDFDMLIATYGEDPGMVGNPEGYTFVSGVMVPEFEYAVLGLEIGEISGLVPTTFGFHIIKRVEPVPENVMLPGHIFAEDVEDDDLLGAKHILIMGRAPTVEDLMVEAVFLAFEARLEDAGLVFLPAFYDIPAGW